MILEIIYYSALTCNEMTFEKARNKEKKLYVHEDNSLVGVYNGSRKSILYDRLRVMTSLSNFR